MLRGRGKKERGGGIEKGREGKRAMEGTERCR